MRTALLLCALAAVRAEQIPDWVSKMHAQSYSHYNECECFISLIYGGYVDDAYDAPDVTLRQQPELAKCRLMRTLTTHEVQGMTAVYAAVAKDRSDWLAEILANGGDPDARHAAKSQDDDDAFPLFVAAQYNNVEAVRLLIAAGARQEETMNNGQAAINAAALFGNWEVVALLAQSRPGLVNLAGVDQWTGQRGSPPLNAAAAGGEPYASQVKAQLATLSPAQRKNAKFAMPSEDEADYAKTIWTLVEHGADVNFQSTSDQTALTGAAINGKRLIVEALLGEGADPNVADAGGMGPLMWACQHGHDAVARVLVNHDGCDCDAQTPSGGTTAIFATYHGKMKALAAVAGSGKCDLDAVDVSGEAAAHIAAYNNKWRILKILAMSGADIDKGNAIGRTPTLLAAKHNDAKAIEVLAAHGANLTKAVYEPKTDSYTGPHHVALAVQALDALAALVSAGVDVCVGGKGFRDAVIGCMNENVLDSLRFLVEEAGCPVNATESFSPDGPYTIQPALHAISFDRVEAFAILAAAGADLDTVDGAADVVSGHEIPHPSLADLAAVASPEILKLLKEEYGREPSGYWQVTHVRGEPPRFVPVDEENATTTLPPRGEL